MNMVRAGVVDHPQEWKQSGYHELAGLRKRYLIINKNRLLSCLMMDGDIDAFTAWYNQTLAESLDRTYQARDAYWTEAHAVGREPWLKCVYRKMGFKNKKIRHVQTSASSDICESTTAYYIEG